MDSCFSLTGAHQHGIAVSDLEKAFPAEASLFKCQLYTKHVGAVSWELQGSSLMTCTGKADHRFGVCVPLSLICLLKIVN